MNVADDTGPGHGEASVQIDRSCVTGQDRYPKPAKNPATHVPERIFKYLFLLNIYQAKKAAKWLSQQWSLCSLKTTPIWKR
jgi:hypothetical protein